jgi:PPOX class probable F420-dependent enzyme
MISDKQREFLATHRLCVVGYSRVSGPPALTPVYYALDGDDVIISTTAGRAKARAADRNPEMSVCILAEESPFDYVTVFGKARIEHEGTVDAMMAIGGRMMGAAIAESARLALEQRAIDEGRVVLRITPERVISR